MPPSPSATLTPAQADPPATQGLCCDVTRGPNWLFVKLHPAHASAATSESAARWRSELYDICRKHFTYRLVVEMHEVDQLSTDMASELDALRRELAEHEGALRVCGMRPHCEESLRGSHLGAALRNHQTRESAVLGR